MVNEHIKNLSPKSAGAVKSEKAIRLDKGELPFPPSPRVIKAISEAAATINRYPEILGGCLREALAKYTGAKKEQIVIGNGSDELIELAVKVFVKLGEEVLIPVPTFFVYWHSTQIIGANPVFVNRNPDFGLDVKILLNKISPRTKLIFIANPNNPTGNIVSRETIIEILKNVECAVVVDECYYEICQSTVVDLIEKYQNLIVLRSFSKSFGLAGVRIGYAITNEALADYFYRAAQLFPVNKLALVAAEAALSDLEYVNDNLKKICQEREILSQELEKIGLQVYPSKTNFLFVRTKKLGIPSSELVKALSARQIFVADFGLKPGLDAYYFRTAVGTATENQALLAGLKEAIAEFSIK